MPYSISTDFTGTEPAYERDYTLFYSDGDLYFLAVNILSFELYKAPSATSELDQFVPICSGTFPDGFEASEGYVHDKLGDSFLLSFSDATLSMGAVWVEAIYETPIGADNFYELTTVFEWYPGEDTETYRVLMSRASWGEDTSQLIGFFRSNYSKLAISKQDGVVQLKALTGNALMADGVPPRGLLVWNSELQLWYAIAYTAVPASNSDGYFGTINLNSKAEFISTRSNVKITTAMIRNDEMVYMQHAQKSSSLYSMLTSGGATVICQVRDTVSSSSNLLVGFKKPAEFRGMRELDLMANEGAYAVMSFNRSEYDNTVTAPEAEASDIGSVPYTINLRSNVKDLPVVSMAPFTLKSIHTDMPVSRHGLLVGTGLGTSDSTSFSMDSALGDKTQLSEVPEVGLDIENKALGQATGGGIARYTCSGVLSGGSIAGCDVAANGVDTGNIYQSSTKNIRVQNYVAEEANDAATWSGVEGWPVKISGSGPQTILQWDGETLIFTNDPYSSDARVRKYVNGASQGNLLTIPNTTDNYAAQHLGGGGILSKEGAGIWILGNWTSDENYLVSGNGDTLTKIGRDIPQSRFQSNKHLWPSAAGINGSFCFSLRWGLMAGVGSSSQRGGGTVLSASNDAGETWYQLVDTPAFVLSSPDYTGACDSAVMVGQVLYYVIMVDTDDTARELWKYNFIDAPVKVHDVPKGFTLPRMRCYNNSLSFMGNYSITDFYLYDVKSDTFLAIITDEEMANWDDLYYIFAQTPTDVFGSFYDPAEGFAFTRGRNSGNVPPLLIMPKERIKAPKQNNLEGFLGSTVNGEDRQWMPLPDPPPLPPLYMAGDALTYIVGQEGGYTPIDMLNGVEATAIGTYAGDDRLQGGANPTSYRSLDFGADGAMAYSIPFTVEGENRGIGFGTWIRRGTVRKSWVSGDIHTLMTAEINGWTIKWQIKYGQNNSYTYYQVQISDGTTTWTFKEDQYINQAPYALLYRYEWAYITMSWRAPVLTPTPESTSRGDDTVIIGEDGTTGMVPNWPSTPPVAPVFEGEGVLTLGDPSVPLNMNMVGTSVFTTPLAPDTSAGALYFEMIKSAELRGMYE